jgi:hypothetical protein
MNREQDKCQCSEYGYSPDCPNAFYQGGKILHTIEAESKLKPRLYTSPSIVSAGSSSDEVPELIGENELPDNDKRDQTGLMRSQILNSTQNHQIAPHKGVRLTEDADDLYEGIRQTFPSHLSTDVAIRPRMGQGQLQYGDRMMEQNRKSLRKFEPLKVGEQSLTGMSIGGFVVDLSKAAQKASEVAPLPASKLPVIFVDDDMNFHHHFFQGLDILLGKDIVQEIVTADKYYDETDLHLLPMIEGMIKVGYERSDNEITVFTKKVLTSTFEINNDAGPDAADKMLIVAANLWGFQYIESGMQMKEPDLKMWLQNCHRFYRTIWFNTFKSAGVPQFALEGVQTRYEHGRGKKTPVTKPIQTSLTREDYLREEQDSIHRDIVEESIRRSRRRRHRQPKSNGLSAFFQGRN